MKILSSFNLVAQPEAQPRSNDFSVWINGEPLDVLAATKADFAVLECSGPIEVRVRASVAVAHATVRPSIRGIRPATEGRELSFTLDGPQCVCVEAPGLKPLFLYANAPETDRPEPGAPGVRFFEAGAVHEAGEILLGSGETVYIAAGAVVRGSIVAREARGVRIRGRGILDGRGIDGQGSRNRRMILLDRCVDVEVRDLVMIEPPTWMVVLGGCRGARVDGVKQIGANLTSDGVDICGSRDVVIENCCLRNEDDNIAIKAGDLGGGAPWCDEVSNVRVRDCVFLNGHPGNVMEIGYELRTARVHDVVFENIDVLNGHGEGAVFSIHNGDRAVVEDILWKNIRVEHYWDKLVDLRVVHSRYNHDKVRGVIRNIRFEDVHVTRSLFNPGCSVSLLGGISADSKLRDVTFRDFYLNETKALSADDLELYTRHVENVRFL